MQQSTFDQIRTRPRFKLFTEMDKESYTAHLQQYLKNNEADFTGNINREMANIQVKTTEDNYWKPCLSLRTEFDQDENKTVIRGVFGPSSAVWTFFLFLYMLFGIGWMVCFTLFYVAKQIKHTGFGWALPVSLVCLGLIFLTYLAGRIGRKKGKKQMDQLRDFAEKSTLHLETKSSIIAAP